jgi:ribulose-5-phosphate 4-epimerase/fuculose-1-phosphate aldolase
MQRLKEPPARLANDLLEANSILVRHGVLDTFGHISARDARYWDTYVLSRDRAPTLVQAADLVLHDLDGASSTGTNEALDRDRFIDAEIYKVRSDVMCVLFSESDCFMILGAIDSPIRLDFTDTSEFDIPVPTVDIRKHAGDTDLFIRTAALGEALATALGSRAMILLRGKGAIVVGASIGETVGRAIMAVNAARTRLGAVQSRLHADAATSERASVNER